VVGRACGIEVGDMGETKAWHEDRPARLVLRQIEAPGADEEKKDEASLQTESDPMMQLSCRLGDASCAGGYAEQADQRTVGGCTSQATLRAADPPPRQALDCRTEGDQPCVLSLGNQRQLNR
jgi:hypothetical protein